VFQIKIDDSQIRRFLKVSPQRAEWSLKEALKMTGGHYRKALQQDIRHGRIGGDKTLNPITERGRDRRKPPLFNLGSMTRFRVSKSRKAGGLMLRVGFLNIGKLKVGTKSVVAVAKIHEEGKRIRVTPKMRKFFAREKHENRGGAYLKKSTKFLTIPKRPIIEPFWRRYRNEIPRYLERRFFQKFFSKENARLRI